MNVGGNRRAVGRRLVFAFLSAIALAGASVGPTAKAAQPSVGGAYASPEPSPDARRPQASADPPTSPPEGSRTSYSKPVAVFWVGVDRGEDVFPPVDVDAMIAVYEANHFRVLRFDGTSPRVMALSLLRDRQSHPENYLAVTVPLLIHGNGLVTTTGMHADAVGPTATPRQVTPAELASAFLVGIGGDAVADVAEAVCLVGGQCREIPLSGTPLEKKVLRWLVRETDPERAKPLAATKQRQRQLLSRLLDALLVAVRAVSPLAAPVDDDPDGFRPFTYRSEEKAPAANAMSFSDLAEREAFLRPKASGLGR
jgi:hypothetical protein